MQCTLAALCGATLLLLALPAVAAPPEGPDQRGLMTLLKDHMTGQPVIAVGVGDIENGVHFDEAAYAKETKNTGRLQVLSAAVSGDTEIYIPFLVRNAWVIAPETRPEVRTDLTGVTDMEAEGAGLLLNQVLLSLAPDLLASAGSEAGIPAQRLSPEAQVMLARILKPPIKIMQSGDGVWTDPNGNKREGWHYDRVGTVAEPLDLSEIRLRARLWFEAAEVRVGTGVEGQASIQSLGQQRRHQSRIAELGGWRNVEAPVETVSANRFKPSDLDGKPYAQPFGASGVMSVSDALQRVEKATALKLYPGAYALAPVFVGSPEVTCGEVLDGLRLAVTGAWRKVGEGYVLCWDRRGLAALNQTLAETSRDLVARINTLAKDVADDPRWLDIAAKMPFAANDPLAFTGEQRERFYREPRVIKEGDHNTEERPGIAYEEMTPDQQAYLEECAKTDQMSIVPPHPFNPANPWDRPEPEHRPFTPADVRSARLGSDFGPEIGLEIRLPGYGWVRNGPALSQTLAPHRIREIRQKVAEKKAQAARATQAKAAPPQRPQPPPGTFAPKPFTIAAPDRGIMVGPMRAEQLDALARQMKEKRFTTLLYPVLYEGYATAPSKAFPAHPDLEGENGLAAALAAAKANGLKVIGYLSPVAWRSPRNAAHWLDKHPDWLDRDPLGRTRLEWLKDWEGRKRPLPSGLLDIFRRDTVRPTEPEVIRRLETLVDEVAATKAAGLMLLEWERQGIEEDGRPISPPLGFALGDRLAEITRSGFDPLDASLSVTWADSVFVSQPDYRLLGRHGFRSVGVDRSGLQGLSAMWQPSPHAVLADRLLGRAKSLRKDWTTGCV